MIEPAMGKLLIHLNVIDVHAAEGIGYEPFVGEE
jgi:hypothetical protein